MPKTILRLTEEDRATLALLELAFHELPFLQKGSDQGLVKRAKIAKSATPTARIRGYISECIRNHHQVEPCLVLDAIQANDEWDFCRRIFEHEFLQEWEQFYEPQFRLWQEDNHLVGLKNFKGWPPHLAGWHHLKKYGPTGLRELNFDHASMTRALLFEVLHEQNITTLTDLAAMPLNELYAHMKASKFSDMDEQLRDVQNFLRQYYVTIETIMDE